MLTAKKIFILNAPQRPDNEISSIHVYACHITNAYIEEYIYKEKALQYYILQIYGWEDHSNSFKGYCA